MVTIKDIAQAALFADDLRLRLLVQEYLRSTPVLRDVPRPDTNDQQVLATAAGLLEMFAQRSGQEPPDWTRSVGPSPEPIFLTSDALTMKRLRQLCLEESPEPLKKRQLYATPNFLTFV